MRASCKLEDTNSDSVCSVFEKMKPNWARWEADEQQPPRKQPTTPSLSLSDASPVSPLSSKSSSDALSDDSRVVQSNIFNEAYPRLKMAMMMETTSHHSIPASGPNAATLMHNSSSIWEQQQLPLLPSTTSQTWCATTGITTAWQIASPSNIGGEIPSTVLGNRNNNNNSNPGGSNNNNNSHRGGRGIYETLVYHHRYLAYSTPTSPDNRFLLERGNHSFSYLPFFKVLPTVEPGDFSSGAKGCEEEPHVPCRRPPSSMRTQNNNNNYDCNATGEEKRISSDNSLYSKNMKKRHIKCNKLEKKTKPHASPTEPNKRDNYLRFEHWEEENLLRGVEIFGVGKWTSILRNFNFQKKRSAIDLKDKYRNILRAKQRSRMAQLNARNLL